MPHKKLDLFYLLIFVLLNAILKSLYISHAEVALDEPFNVLVAQMSPHNIPAFLNQYHEPPLYQLLLHPFVHLFGPVLPWIRVPSLLFATLTVVFVYLIGTRFFSRKAGVFASLFYTFATFQLFFAHEAGVYALFNLLACISVFLFLTAKDKERIHYSHVLLVVVNALLVYAHYLGFVVWATELTWLVVFRYTYFKSLLLSILTFVASAILFLPQLNNFIARLATVSGSNGIQKPSADDLYYNLMKMLNAPLVAVFVIVLFLAASVKLFVNRNTLKVDENTVFVLHWFVTAYFALFLVSFFVPMFRDRSLLFISGAVYISIAISIDYLLGEEKSWPALGIFVLLFVLSVNLRPDHKTRWKGLVENIAANKRNKTAVFIIPERAAITFSYHYNSGYFKDYNNITSRLQHDGYYTINTISEFSSAPIDSFDRIIIIDGEGHFADKTQSVYKTLKLHFPKTNTNKPFTGVGVYTFNKDANENN